MSPLKIEKISIEKETAKLKDYMKILDLEKYTAKRARDLSGEKAKVAFLRL